MATADGKPTAIVLRIKVRHPDLDAFVDRFASQVTRSGVFIPTRTPRPVGTIIRFEIRTADDRPVLVGQGQVRLIRPHDPAHPRVVAGMAIGLQRVGRDSRDVLLRMLAIRQERGLVDGPEGMPLPGDPDHEPPADADADEPTAAPTSETEDVTSVRAPRPRATADADEPTGLTLAPPAPRPVLARPTVAVAPPRVAEPAPLEPVPPAPAPIAQVAAPPALAAAPPRVRRTLDVTEVPPVALPADDDLLAWPEAQVPLDEVLARARALVGEDLDGELAALAAAPAHVSADEASAAMTAALGRPLRPRTPAATAVPLPVPTLPAAPSTAAVPSAAGADAGAAVAGSSAPPAPDQPATVAAAAPAAAPAAEARAARAQRDRAKREANDRALRERNQRIQRELDERDRRARNRPTTAQPPVASAPPDPLAALRLDDPPPTPAGDATRVVDAAALAAEAMGVADLRSTLDAAGDPDLAFLDSLALEEKPAPRRRPHTVPRAATRPRPPPPPVTDDDDDDGIEISIDLDE